MDATGEGISRAVWLCRRHTSHDCFIRQASKQLADDKSHEVRKLKEQVRRRTYSATAAARLSQCSRDRSSGCFRGCAKASVGRRRQ